MLDFMLTKLKLNGKIGVYGRSLGGIASTHLANKYPHIVNAILVDRTFSELETLSVNRLIGRGTRPIFQLISCQWRCLNDYNFAKAKCLKIATCDPKDDVVDNYSALNVGVARHLSK